MDMNNVMSVEFDEVYRRFIVGPTLNNSKKNVEFFWISSLNVVENVAKFVFLFFFSQMQNFHFNNLFD